MNVRGKKKILQLILAELELFPKRIGDKLCQGLPWTVGSSGTVASGLPG